MLKLTGLDNDGIAINFFQVRIIKPSVNGTMIVFSENHWIVVKETTDQVEGKMAELLR